MFIEVLDLSLSATGIVTWTDGRVTVDTIKSDPDPIPARRHEQILGRIFGPLDTRPAHTPLVVKEALLTPGRGRVPHSMTTEHGLAGIHALVDYGLYRRGIKLVEVPADAIKKFATGKRSASKSDMRVEAVRRLEHIATCRNDNEADALWLAAMTIHKYGLGEPWAKLPVVNTLALDAVTWPDLPVPKSCTPADALWCPLHGNCRCRTVWPDADPDCPLHGPTSGHDPVPF